MSALTDTVPRAPMAKPRLKRSIGLWMATALAGVRVASALTLQGRNP
jgi:hypothetical protein